MAAKWAVVANTSMPLGPDESLPDYHPQLSSAEPSPELAIDEANSLLIQAESVDAARAFCAAHSSSSVWCSGRAPRLVIKDSGCGVSVLLTCRTDVTASTAAPASAPMSNGASLASVGNAMGATMAQIGGHRLGR